MLSLLRSDVVRVKVALKRIPRSTRTTDSASAGAGAGVNGADAEERYGAEAIKESLTYCDDDGDIITVTSDADFEAALKGTVASSGSSGGAIKFYAEAKDARTSAGITPHAHAHDVVVDGAGYQWLPSTATASTVDVHAGFRIQFSTW
eukprot:gene20287-6783_t